MYFCQHAACYYAGATEQQSAFVMLSTNIRRTEFISAFVINFKYNFYSALVVSYNYKMPAQQQAVDVVGKSGATYRAKIITDKMQVIRILKFILPQFAVLTLTVFLTLYFKENGDMGSVILGTIEYTPYIILLTIINFGLITVGQKYLPEKAANVLPTYLTSLIWTIIFLIKSGHFTVLYWRLMINEFIILNIIIILVNLTTLALWHKKIDRHEDLPTT